MNWLDEARRLGAVFSPCRTWRYALWREWIGGTGYALSIGLNPSTADERENDQTLRRDIAFAKSWGASALCKVNLFAFRETDPVAMRRASDPVGPDNDAALLSLASHAAIKVAVWGVHGGFRERDREVCALIPDLSMLRLTKEGYPEHSLRLPGSLSPVPWEHGARDRRCA